MTARIKVKWLSIQRKTIDPLDMPDGDLELWSIPDFDNGSPSITNRQSIGSSKKVVFPCIAFKNCSTHPQSMDC